MAEPLIGARVREPVGQPEGALVLLHGRGADEHDLHPLLDALDPERRLLGVTPRGPLSLPPGGAHWYALGGLPTPDPDTFWPTFEAASSWLDELPVPLERTVLGGFSQGAVMSWALGLGRGAAKRPAAIIALSGFMPQVDGLELALAGLEGFTAPTTRSSRRSSAAWPASDSSRPAPTCSTASTRSRTRSIPGSCRICATSWRARSPGKLAR